MHRVSNKEGVEVRTEAIRIRRPPPKPPPWKKQPSDREAALAEERRRVVDFGVFSKSELVAQLPFGTTVRLVGDVKRAESGEEFCRVEAGDVAGWAMFSGKDLVDDPDNEYGYSYEPFRNFDAVTEEDTVADAPAKVLTTPAE